MKFKALASQIRRAISGGKQVRWLAAKSDSSRRLASRLNLPGLTRAARVPRRGVRRCRPSPPAPDEPPVARPSPPRRLPSLASPPGHFARIDRANYFSSLISGRSLVKARLEIARPFEVGGPKLFGFRRAPADAPRARLFAAFFRGSSGLFVRDVRRQSALFGRPDGCGR